MDVYEFQSDSCIRKSESKSKWRLNFMQYLDRQSKLLSCKYPFLTKKQIKEKAKEQWNKNNSRKENRGNLSTLSNTYSNKKNKTSISKFQTFEKKSFISYSSQRALKYSLEEKVPVAEKIRKEMYGILKKDGETKTSKEFKVTFVEECDNITDHNYFDDSSSNEIDLISKLPFSNDKIDNQIETNFNNKEPPNLYLINDNHLKKNENLHDSSESESDYDFLQTLFSLERFKNKNVKQNSFDSYSEKELELPNITLPLVYNSEENNEKQISPIYGKEKSKNDLLPAKDDSIFSIDGILSCNSDKLNTALINESDKELFSSSVENNEELKEFKTKNELINDLDEISSKLKTENKRCNSKLDSDLYDVRIAAKIISPYNKLNVNDCIKKLNDEVSIDCFENKFLNIKEKPTISQEEQSFKTSEINWKINSNFNLSKIKVNKKHYQIDSPETYNLLDDDEKTSELMLKTEDLNLSGKSQKKKNKEKQKLKVFEKKNLNSEIFENKSRNVPENSKDNICSVLNFSDIEDGLEDNFKKLKTNESSDFIRNIYTDNSLKFSKAKKLINSPNTDFLTPISFLKNYQFFSSNNNQEQSGNTLDEIIDSMKKIGTILSSNFISTTPEELTHEDNYDNILSKEKLETKQDELYFSFENKENINISKNNFKNKKFSKNLKKKSKLLSKNKNNRFISKKCIKNPYNKPLKMLKSKIIKPLNNENEFKNDDFKYIDSDAKNKVENKIILNSVEDNLTVPKDNIKNKLSEKNCQLNFSPYDDTLSLSSENEDPFSVDGNCTDKPKSNFCGQGLLCELFDD